MGRVKALAENTLIFAICNFTSKLIVFFMLPFYTSVLSKEEFGTVDLITTIVGLLYPVLTLGIAHGVMRYALDKDVDTKKVFTIGFSITGVGAIILIAFIPLLIQIDFLQKYLIVFLFLYFTNIYQHLLSLFARGIQKVRLVGIAGVSSSFTVVFCNLLFLFVYHFGVEGYIWSIVISNIVSIIILFVGAKMFRYITADYDIMLTKEMLNYSLPLMPNSLSWWINHSANRYILNFFCGVADVGLYSAASKMPSMIDTFRGIFIQAWQLSTITEYDKKDSAAFFKGMYQAYNLFLILLTGSLILLSQAIGSVLYSKDFYDAWKLAPFLFLGILFGSLIAYYSPTYLAHKKTKILFTSTFVGAIITIALNFLLIPNLGIIGTAVTSVLSNFSIYIYLHLDSKKYMDFEVNNLSYYLSYICIAIQATSISLFNMSPWGWVSILCFSMAIFLVRNDLKVIIDMGKRIIKNRSKRISHEQKH